MPRSRNQGSWSWSCLGWIDECLGHGIKGLGLGLVWDGLTNASVLNQGSWSCLGWIDECLGHGVKGLGLGFVWDGLTNASVSESRVLVLSGMD